MLCAILVLMASGALRPRRIGFSNFATKVQLEALHVNCVRDIIHPVFSLNRREFAEFKAASVNQI